MPPPRAFYGPWHVVQETWKEAAMRAPLIVTAEGHTVWRNSERKIRENEARERSYRAQLAEKLSAQRNRAAARATLIQQFATPAKRTGQPRKTGLFSGLCGRGRIPSSISARRVERASGTSKQQTLDHTTLELV